MISVRFALACAALAALGLGAAAPSAAQDTQVPVDPDSTVYVIDPALREAGNLFPAVSGFEEATLYRVEGGGYELVVRYQEEGRVRRERRSLSREEVRTLRARVGRALAARTGQRSFTQEGRYGLIAATTVHGLIEGGLLAGALGTQDGNAATIVLLGGAAGFFVPLFATQDTRVTEGEADATFYGGLQGYGHAVQLTALFTGGDAEGRGTAGLAALLGAAEGTAGYLAARRNDWTGGHAEMITYTGLGGNAIGLGLGAALLGEDDTADDERRARVLGGTALLGSLAGMYLGHRMGRTDRYTEGDARIYVQTAVQGANLVGSFLSGDEFPNARTGSLLLTGSAVAGGLLGRRLVRDRDFTGTQGNLVALGSVAGSLLGLAVTLESGETATAIAQALGSAAGFGVTYGLLEGEARRQAASATSSFDLNVRVGPGLARRAATGEAGLADRIAPHVALSASF
ncbi:MAG: hypothetical protein ABEL97_09180 [Salinibacter sp.]